MSIFALQNHKTHDPFDFLDVDLAAIRDAGLYRTLRRTGSACAAQILLDGREYDNFCSNNYLGFASHPAVIEAASAACAKYGSGAGAARLIGGNHAQFNELECALAEFKQTEAALVFSSGYLANLGAISTLAEKQDAIFLDRYAHASLIDAARLSGARIRVFKHNDPDSLEPALKRSSGARRRLIVVDGVYSMDGDLAPIPELLMLAEKHDALIFVDDAHGTGIIGHQGRGVLSHFKIESPRIIQMGTLSKALGSLGGYIAGERRLINWLVNRARAFIFDTALPASAVAAALKSLELLQTEPSHLQNLWANIERAHAMISNLGLPTRATESAIFPVVLGDAEKTMNAAKWLMDQGLFIAGIRPPTVKKGESRLRLTLMATHTPDQISRLQSAFARLNENGFNLPRVCPG